MDAQFRSWLNTLILWRPREDFSDYGAPVFGDPVELACFSQEIQSMVRNAEGQEVISEQTLYFDGEDRDDAVREVILSIDTKGSIELPDGSAPPILRVRKHMNERGIIEIVEVNI